jgi:hypothetical protein
MREVNALKKLKIVADHPTFRSGRAPAIGTSLIVVFLVD